MLWVGGGSRVWSLGNVDCMLAGIDCEMREYQRGHMVAEHQSVLQDTMEIMQFKSFKVEGFKAKY